MIQFAKKQNKLLNCVLQENGVGKSEEQWEVHRCLQGAGKGTFNMVTRTGTWKYLEEEGDYMHIKINKAVSVQIQGKRNISSIIVNTHPANSHFLLIKIKRMDRIESFLVMSRCHIS